VIRILHPAGDTDSEKGNPPEAKEGAPGGSSCLPVLPLGVATRADFPGEEAKRFSQ